MKKVTLSELNEKQMFIANQHISRVSKKNPTAKFVIQIDGMGGVHITTLKAS